jgi:phosphoribosylformylglycinamidine cyclo-ligase
VHSERGNADLYKEAGVDVAAGDQLVDWLQEQGPNPAKSRYGATVAGIGGFAALFRPNFSGMVDPLLITSTDGVGTKVLLGLQTGHLEGLGRDLVAMCVNDLYTVGGRPLLFLDYYATGVLDQAQFKAVLTGIRAGCTQSGAALIGGETAELPGLYARGHFDLAGFVVGVVDGARRIGPERVELGDELYALPSSGFHSNGYSLLRHWLKDRTTDATTLASLMAPTRIYHEVPELLDRVGPDALHALANITGGGISGNLPRVLPKDTRAAIDFAALPTPAWMRAFLEANGTTARAQEGVFNLGAGMIAVVAPARAAEVVAAARELGLELTRIGKIVAGRGEAAVDFV